MVLAVFETRIGPEGPAIGHDVSPRCCGRWILMLNRMGTIITCVSPHEEGRSMPKRESARSKERGPEALVEWMLKAKGVSKRNIRLLLSSTDKIRLAWDRDHRGTKTFPMNTAFLLSEIEARLKGWRPRMVRSVPYPKA